MMTDVQRRKGCLEVTLEAGHPAGVAQPGVKPDKRLEYRQRGGVMGSMVVYKIMNAFSAGFETERGA